MRRGVHIALAGMAMLVATPVNAATWVGPLPNDTLTFAPPAGLASVVDAGASGDHYRPIHALALIAIALVVAWRMRPMDDVRP